MAFNLDLNLQATIKKNADLLASQPGNIPLRTKVLKDQVTLTSKQLGISEKDAGSVIKNYTAGYAKTKGADPQAVLDALSTEEQNILNYSSKNPSFAGVDINTATKIASFAAGGSLVLFVGSLIAGIVAIITVGPEAAAGALVGEGLLATLGNAFKIPAMRTAIIGFALAGTLEAFSLVVPMITKQMIDNGSIGPGLRISALKDAEDLKAKLSPTASPATFTPAQFTDYASSLEVAGIKGINDPFKGQSLPYSRANLADLVKGVYGQASSTGAGTTVVKLIPQIAQYLIMPGTPVPSSSSTLANTSQASSSSTSVKVFTGIVSQGTVGNGLAFAPRPDDLIQSMSELQDAINNNVASYLAALPSRVIYEIKIVSSVIVNGIKKTGTAQQVVSGYSSAGVPKYKTVVNKFAVADLYFLTDKGSRSKLTSIVLGPTDALTFSPDGTQLAVVAQAITSNVITTSTDDIHAVASNTPTKSVAPAPAPTTNTNGAANQNTSGSNYVVYLADLPGYEARRANGQRIDLYQSEIDAYNAAGIPWPPKTPTPVISSNAPVVTAPSTGAAVSPPAQTPTQGNQPPATVTPVQALPATALTAQTLSAFYTALGRALPSLADRSNLYQSLGLGQAAFYTGTAEQNTNLLAALKLKGV